MIESKSKTLRNWQSVPPVAHCQILVSDRSDHCNDSHLWVSPMTRKRICRVSCVLVFVKYKQHISTYVNICTLRWPRKGKTIYNGSLPKHQGSRYFTKPTIELKILGARRVKWSKFDMLDSHILGTTVWNSVPGQPGAPHLCTADVYNMEGLCKPRLYK